MSVKKFLSWFDIHYGFDRRGGHKYPSHNPKALAAVLKFADDFKPDYMTLGGDQLDLRVISHWTKKSKLSMEGLRLRDDFVGFKTEVLDPLNRVLPEKCSKRVHVGNHEAWVHQFLDENPALEGLLDVDTHVGYTASGWTTYQQGQASRIGKLHIVHGDHVRGTNIAKNALDMYEESVRFGHFHTYAAYTKQSALNVTHVKTGVAVPCLCSRVASYGKGAPNRWMTGFNLGYVFPDGTFTDTVVILINNRFAWNGRVYGG
jgi:hypothetical protein